VTTLLEPLRLERRPPPPPRARHARHDWLLVGGLVLCYALLQSAFVHQPPLSDQMHYFVDAATLPHISEPPHQTLRIGLTIPVWLMIQLLDYSEAAYYAVPYLFTVGLITATYWLGRLLDSRATGAIAGLLVFANPFTLDDASQLLPDVPAAALLTGAIALLIWQWQHRGDTVRPRRRDQLVLIGVGALLGWAYLVREFVVLWFPVAVLVAIVLQLPRSWWRLVVAGTAAMFAVELLWGLVFFRNPFARIIAALNQPTSPPWRVTERAELISSGAIPDTHLEMLTAMPRSLVASDVGWLLAVLFLVLVVAAVLLPSPRLRLLAIWVVLPVVLMLVVIQVAWLFENRILRPEKLRYWLPVIPPLVVGGVAALRAVGQRLLDEVGGAIAIAVAASLALVGVLMTGAELDRAKDFTRTGQDEYLEFREWAATSGETCPVIWVDADHWRDSERWVPMYLRSFWGRPIWDGEVRHLNRGRDWVDISELDTGALVRARSSLERRTLERQVLPVYLLDPPSSWRVLLRTERDRVRVLGVGPSTCARP
jgi:4-amino-4-deoxy-L-arabinose transferase-like glycosyltransferase